MINSDFFETKNPISNLGLLNNIEILNNRTHLFDLNILSDTISEVTLKFNPIDFKISQGYRTSKTFGQNYGIQTWVSDTIGGKEIDQRVYISRPTSERRPTFRSYYIKLYDKAKLTFDRSSLPFFHSVVGLNLADNLILHVKNLGGRLQRYKIDVNEEFPISLFIGV